ncbi:nuclear transport factor 2 family protein [Gordonia paraffinivorans]|uniref:nuclear transport factor 2 family protein n=1 Tax=Gordonia paraffinivorans TaxID=175628 RepID=UPI001445C1FC|nr:nuclear transport factor 2 family protein [Gordonia paraffinivorans]
MTTTASGTDIQALVTGYLTAISTGRSADIAARYAPDARLEDPVGSEPRVGREQIEEFYRGLDGVDTSAELITLRTAGSEAAFHFRVTTSLPDRTIVIEPIDVMTFDEDGLITSMRAFWSPADVAVTQGDR